MARERAKHRGVKVAGDNYFLPLIVREQFAGAARATAWVLYCTLTALEVCEVFMGSRSSPVFMPSSSARHGETLVLFSLEKLRS